MILAIAILIGSALAAYSLCLLGNEIDARRSEREEHERFIAEYDARQTARK